MSVYNQLDYVKPDEIDPFGRVSPRYAEGNRIYLVGRSLRKTDSGVLVCSSNESSQTAKWALRRAQEAEQLMLQRLQIELAHESEQPGYRDAGYSSWWKEENKLRALNSAIKDSAYSDCTIADMPAWIEKHKALIKRAQALEALPLIVLAGLR